MPTDATQYEAMPQNLYLGLMSGTSMDGIDAALVEFGDDADGRPFSLRTTICQTLPASLRGELLALCSPGEDEINRLGRADRKLGRAFAAAVQAVLDKAGVAPAEVTAIGCHGQTVRHHPDGEDSFTLQIGDPNTVAELCGVEVVADFRRRDIAAGGQGAPLVPAFHAAAFAAPGEIRLIVNLGGISNLSALCADGTVLGGDLGPGNLLMDHWCERYTGQPFDRDGEWARGGKVEPWLLQRLLEYPFFQRPWPASTGREEFNPSWLQLGILRAAPNAQPQDVQATLCELTAAAVARGVAKVPQATGVPIHLCGGGAHNTYLVERIAVQAQGHPVRDTSELGLEPEWVEAVGFAWLARQTLLGRAGNAPAATGAAGERVLGGRWGG